jgi:hypothetical protein
LALKVWVLAGAAAVWSTVALAGPTVIPMGAQSGVFIPPHPIINRSAALGPTHAKNLFAKNLFAKNLEINIAYTPESLLGLL